MSAKTEPTTAVASLPTQVKQAFKEHLDKQLTARAKTPVPAKAPAPSHKPLIGPVSKLTASSATATSARPQSAAAVTQANARVAQRAQATVTATARQRVEREAERLSDVREGHHATESAREVRAETQVNSAGDSTRRLKSMMDTLVRELTAEVPQGSKPAASAPGLDAGGLLPPSIAPASAPEGLKPTAAAEAIAMIERIESLVKNNRPALQLSLSSSLARSVEIERVGPKEVALTLVGKDGPPSAEAVSRIRDELAARGLKVAALTLR